MDSREPPGSHGEHVFQHAQGSVSRARAFYQKQMLDYLNADMQEYIGEQEMFFLASADAHGECDCSFRAGEKGFVRVLDDRTLLHAEFRGNGVFATLGNISENPHAAFLFLDFFHAGIGLHVNGKASVCSAADLARARYLHPAWPEVAAVDGRTQPELWVLLAVEEAYIHCSKHVPILKKVPKEIEWGTDDVRKKGGDYFHAKQSYRPALDGPAGDPGRG
jgi:predicted pyridoxine 5'-phosphate oxidase superfamily flavin-nucleotide-binding protein